MAGLALAQAVLGETPELGGGLVVGAVAGGEQSFEGGVAVTEGAGVRRDGPVVGNLVLGRDRHTHAEPTQARHDRGEVVVVVRGSAGAGLDGLHRLRRDEVVDLLHEPSDNRTFDGIELRGIPKVLALALAGERARHQSSFWNVAQRP